MSTEIQTPVQAVTTAMQPVRHTSGTIGTGVRTATPARAASPALSQAGLATLLLGATLPIVDFFVVNVALPTIDRTLHASAATLELVVAGYGTAYALFLVIGGRLGDAVGRRRLFTSGLAAFTVTSLLCGLAPTATTLVLARVAQGAAAALMIPQVLSTIQATTSGERRSHALGLFGAVAGGSTVIGQLLGGVLVSLNIAGTSWRPIFLVNVPAGVLGLLLARRTVPDTRAADPVGVDRSGTALFAVTLLALLLPLTEGRSLHWPVWSWLCLAAAPVGAVAFVAIEQRAERLGRTPLLPLSLVRVPSMSRGLLLGVPFFASFGGFMFVFAVTLQEHLGLGPLASGLAVVPMAVPFLVTSLFSSRIVARWGSRVVGVGGLLQAVGAAVIVGTTILTWPDHTAVVLAPGMAVAGVGQSLVMTTLFRVVLSNVPVERAGVGSGVLTTTQQTSLALGTATLGSLFVSLSAPGSLGVRNAFVAVVAVPMLVGLVVAVCARRLPDPRG